MIHNLHHYRLPNGTEIRASGPIREIWLFFAHDAPHVADPLYVFFPGVSGALQEVLFVDSRDGWVLQPTKIMLQDLEDLGE